MLHSEMLIDGHFIGGPCDQAVGKLVMKAPYDGAIVGTAAEGGMDEAMGAIAAATAAFSTWRHSTRLQRQTLLRRIAALVRERESELVEVLTLEVGKPKKWSLGEVTRLALTFDLAANESTLFGIESLPVDYDPRGANYSCTVERFPIGPVLGIVPYNWPYNLAAHKLAPALATGNTVILKPSSAAPLSTLTLARLIHEAGCPPGVVNAVVVPSQVAEKMALDPRVKMVSFTGSPAVGWSLKGLIPDKKVSLELGADSSVIVCEDADLDWATERITLGKYGYAGQICIAIQHVLAHEQVYDDLKARLIEATKTCPTGDPSDENTVCGPLISAEAADKVMSWIEEAVQGGGNLLAGGTRSGNVVSPTLIENPPENSKLSCQEVFGPVLTLRKYTEFSEALHRVNSSDYGIHAGVFTSDTVRARQAYEGLEVGGVIINDYPTLRFDIMPYGGVKKSGFGREGVRYAMEEMTELKTFVVKNR